MLGPIKRSPRPSSGRACLDAKFYEPTLKDLFTLYDLHGDGLVYPEAFASTQRTISHLIARHTIGASDTCTPLPALGAGCQPSRGDAARGGFHRSTTDPLALPTIGARPQTGPNLPAVDGRGAGRGARDRSMYMSGYGCINSYGVARTSVPSPPPMLTKQSQQIGIGIAEPVPVRSPSLVRYGSDDFASVDIDGEGVLNFRSFLRWQSGLLEFSSSSSMEKRQRLLWLVTELRKLALGPGPRPRPLALQPAPRRPVAAAGSHRPAGAASSSSGAGDEAFFLNILTSQHRAEITVEASRILALTQLQERVATELNVWPYQITLSRDGTVLAGGNTLEELEICNSNVRLCVTIGESDKWQEMSNEDFVDLVMEKRLDTHANLLRPRPVHVDEIEFRQCYIPRLKAIEKQEAKRHARDEQHRLLRDSIVAEADTLVTSLGAADAAAQLYAKGTDAEVVALERAENCRSLRDEVQQDLDAVKPVLDFAFRALEAVTAGDMSELRSCTKPPDLVVAVGHAICIMFEEQTTWDSATQLFGDIFFLRRLVDYDKDNIPPSVMNYLEPYIARHDFTHDTVAVASRSAAAMCAWVHAMHMYNTVTAMVKPKKEALQLAQEALEDVREEVTSWQTQAALAQGMAAVKANADKSPETLESKMASWKARKEAKRLNQKDKARSRSSMGSQLRDHSICNSENSSASAPDRGSNRNDSSTPSSCSVSSKRFILSQEPAENVSHRSNSFSCDSSSVDELQRRQWTVPSPLSYSVL